MILARLGAFGPADAVWSGAARNAGGPIVGILFAFAQSLCWAGVSIILRSLSIQLDAFAVNGLRAAWALVLIIPLIWLTGGVSDLSLITPTRVLFLVGSVIVGGVFGDAAYVMSLKALGVARAFPISNSFPLFAVLFSVLLLGAPLSWQMLLGMALVLLGVYLVARPRRYTVLTQETPLDPRQAAKGIALAVLASALWGLTTVTMSLGLRDAINPVVATGVRVPAVVVLSLLASAWRGGLRDIRRMTRRTLILVALAGLLGWGTAGSLYAAAIQLIGPAKTAIISATAPL
ncbi:MAG: DMT family transporter, partial [Chloroflexi bacterium]|nr:DMT family transporter [Chloroflexota bacterium]